MHEEELALMARAIVGAVSALETNPFTGDRTALAFLLGALPCAERISGFQALRVAQQVHEPDAGNQAATNKEQA